WRARRWRPRSGSVLWNENRGRAPKELRGAPPRFSKWLRRAQITPFRKCEQRRSAGAAASPGTGRGTAEAPLRVNASARVFFRCQINHESPGAINYKWPIKRLADSRENVDDEGAMSGTFFHGTTPDNYGTID